MLSILVPILLMHDALGEECLRASLTSDLREPLQEAEAAFADFDDSGFDDALDRAALLLPCLEAPVPRDLAAHYHRLQGVRLYVSGREDAGMASLAAGRVLEPEYAFPDALFPPEHALRYRYEQLPTAPGATTRAPRPRQGRLLLDGEDTLDRGVRQAVIAQLVDPEGSVLLSRYIAGDQLLPEYDAVPRVRTRWALLSAGSAAASGLTLGLAWAARAKFESDDPAHDLDDLARLQGAANGWFAASVAFGAGAVGAGAAAIAVGPR